MRIVQASFQIEDRDELRGGLHIIERAGRACYKSDGKATGDSADAFVKNLIRRRHLSVLEHGDMIFEISDRHIYENVAEGLQLLRDSGKQPPMLEMTNVNQRYIVSGNIRAWLELFAIGSLAGRYFIGHFDPVFIRDMGFIDEDAEPDSRVRQIHYADLRVPPEKTGTSATNGSIHRRSRCIARVCPPSEDELLSGEHEVLQLRRRTI